MFKIDPNKTDTASVGRMGELVVELELVSRGWLVGNFNASMNNSTGWDLFATKEGHSIKLRVKAKRPGIDTFRWGAKPSNEILLKLDLNDPSDFVAAVNFRSEGGYDVYIVSALEVEQTLTANHAAYLSGMKANGEPRKDSSQRNLTLNDRVGGPAGHGYRKLWESYRNNWGLLEGNN